MRLYKFTSSPGTLAALTKDESGANLPQGNWTPAGEMNIESNDPPRIGASSAEILADMDKAGYHIWPQATES